ncbi:MAG TPA: ornithine cyclodeaminase [Bacteroidales bacterium]|nr:ornithine cyclodeaminase [Bacteroidales bacterium]
MIHIQYKEIHSAVSYTGWVDMIEKSFKLEPGKDYIMPLRTHVDFDDNTLLLMPCITENYFSTKLITLFQGNIKKGKEPLQGLVILNKRETGEALAILDAPAITAMRTAAVGSFAVRHLSPVDSSNLGIIGLGTQGLHQALFACSERNIQRLIIYDRNTNAYSAFTERFIKEYPDIEIIIAKNSHHLCENSEIIITATNSGVPVLPDDAQLLKDRTIIGIGSYKKNMREFPDTLYKLADKIYVDSMHGLEESGDLIYPLRKGFLYESDFLIAGQLMKNKKETFSTEVFKSVGTALFDLLASILVYETLYMK